MTSQALLDAPPVTATISIQVRPSVMRCPACHDELGGALLELTRCEGCGVAQHASCMRELGRCPTFACRWARTSGPSGGGARLAPPVWTANRAPAPARWSAPSFAWASLAFTAALPVALALFVVTVATRTHHHHTSVWDLALHAAALAGLANLVGAGLGVAAVVRARQDGSWSPAGALTALVNLAPWILLALVVAAS